MSLNESSWENVQNLLSPNIKLNACTLSFDQEKHPPGHFQFPFPIPLHATSANGFGPGGGLYPLVDLDRGGRNQGGSKSDRTPSMISMLIKLLPYFQKKDKVRK